MSLVRWIPWVLLSGLPLLALPNMPDLYGPVRWTVIALVAAGAWATLFRLWPKVVRTTGKWPLIAMLVFLGMGFLSLTVALHPLEAFWDVMRWTMIMGLVMVLAWGYQERKELFLETLRAAAVATVIIGGVRLLQIAGIAGGIPGGGDPTASVMANPNFLAGVMAILTVMSLGLALMDRGIWRILGAAMTALAGVLTAIGGSSGAVLALAAAVAVLAEGVLAMGPLRGLHERLKWLRPALIGVAMLSGLVALAWMYTKVAAVDLTLVTMDSTWNDWRCGTKQAR
ncbi:MAG: hypothetical protein U0176_03650 [Bacteroidia bacterium]